MHSSSDGTESRLGHLSAHNIGEGLYLLRARAQMKRDHLARQAGVAPGTVWALETNRTQNPNMSIIRSIVRILCQKTGDDMEEVFTEFGRLLDDSHKRDGA